MPVAVTDHLPVVLQLAGHLSSHHVCNTRNATSTLLTFLAYAAQLPTTIKGKQCRSASQICRKPCCDPVNVSLLLCRVAGKPHKVCAAEIETEIVLVHQRKTQIAQAHNNKWCCLQCKAIKSISKHVQQFVQELDWSNINWPVQLHCTSVRWALSM